MQRFSIPSYRADIDGLRAVAILSVLLFHFQIGPFTGGFIGVDLFFVLSGYLITQHLQRTRLCITSVCEYYIRRFWRIVPAYMVCLSITMYAGSFILLPPDARDLSYSGLASIFFGANFYFSNSSSYFDVDASYKPLLHLWSLSVEMQYYILCPALIAIASRMSHFWQVCASVLVLLLSLAACQLLAIADPKIAFYSLPTRLWEFTFGGVAALCSHARFSSTRFGKTEIPSHGAFRSYYISVAMCLVIVGSCAVFAHDKLLWPAPWALPVVVGTVAVLYFGDKSPTVSSILTVRPLTIIGKWSYSLYLVHWPIFVFVSYNFFPSPPLWLRILALLICFPLAFCLYRFVETPMRRAQQRPATYWNKYAASGAIVTGVVLSYCWIYFAPENYVRRPSSVIEASSSGVKFVCALTQPQVNEAKHCIIGDHDRTPTSVLWGDSHAMHLAPGFLSLLNNVGGTMLVASKDACPPLIELDRISHSLTASDKCRRSNAATFATILASPSIREVVIAARWAFYSESTRFGREHGSAAYLVDGSTDKASSQNSQALMVKRLSHMLETLSAAGKIVILVAQGPEMGFDAARCVTLHPNAQTDERACSISFSDVVDRQTQAMHILVNAAVQTGATVVDPKNVLCDLHICPGLIRNSAVYKDDNHLSHFGSEYVVKRLFAIKLD
jgi:peptidoglycan/LPS O-acetylase OafA/YrhL